MVRVVALTIAILSLAPGLARGQEEGARVASPRCVNCDDPELLAWLQPLDPEAETYVCSLRLQLRIEADGQVAAADPVDETPLLCEQRATHWAAATRWEVPESAAPIEARLPLEFEIQKTIRPRCVERCDVQSILAEMDRMRNPRASREGGYESVLAPGFHCEPELGIRIDETGEILDVQIREGGDNVDCARVARRWADSTRWTPAFSDGEPVTVWIAQRLRISTSR